MILMGLLLVYKGMYKGVYGSDKREPIWHIWLLVIYGWNTAAQVDGDGLGSDMGSLFWADGLSIETQPHPLSSCPSYV